MNRFARAVAGGPMLAITWRCHRWPLIAWTSGLLLVFAATAFSVNGLYTTTAELQTYAEATASDTAIYAINGRPYGLDTIGGVIVYEFAFIGAIAIPLMAIILMTRMTRREEQTGRMELLRAGIVGRAGAMQAAGVLIGSAFVVLAAGMAAVLLALGQSWPGVVLYPVGSALLGVAFAALAALCAQLVANARLVTALGLAVLAVAFAVRGVGDVRENALVWASPLGWTEQTRSFDEARWWPVLPLIAIAILAYAAALRVAVRRDLGEGVFAQRRGKSAAGRVVQNPFGFAARQHRNAVAGWSAIAVLVGASFGSLGDAFTTVTEGNETLSEILAGGSDAANAYVSFVVLMIALVCMGFAVSGVGRAAQEESEGRLEPMLSGDLSRTRWLIAQATAVGGGTLVVALAGGVGLGVSDAAATGDSSQVARLVGATFAYLPAAALLLALSVALYALRPGLLWLSWLPLVFVTIVAVLGETLQLPAWVKEISPLTWVGRIPLEDANVTAMVAALGAALALVAVALGAFGRRDIPTH